MSDDPLARKLSQFRPDGSGLDRDALLFAAGRATARPNRRWIALFGVLAATQVLTVTMLLWPRPTPPAPDNTAPAAQIATVEPPLRAAPEGSELWTLRQRMIDGDGELPPPPAYDPMIPEQASLRAFGTPPAELFN